MDTFSLHRMVGAVRDSLSRAGLPGFSLWRVEDPARWFDFGWLPRFIEGRRHRTVPLWHDGEALPAFDLRNVWMRGGRRLIRSETREGVIHLLGDCLVAFISYLTTTGSSSLVVVAGERRPGAFQKLLDAYSRFELAASRNSGWIEVIGGASIPRPTGLDWDDVVLPAAFRQELRQQVDSFFAAGDLYRRLGIPYRRGLLFTGPPGNGKTSVLRVIASRRPEPFVWVTGQASDLGDFVELGIDRAIVLAPSILCLEDVDSLLTNDGSLSKFLNRLDGLAPMEGVLILATTNHPERLDEAVTNRPSRFDRIFVFDNPAAPERRAYLSKQFGEAFDERLVARSEGMSFAQLKEAWVTACLEALSAKRPEPDSADAVRAFDRLRRQGGARVGEWPSDRSVGFQRSILSRKSDAPSP